MNILDIAIAKKLAGGGGGSGTDNYNDLSNLPKINDTTLSGNKSSSALGLQSEINSDSKLASDLVDDTNQDNKFVTSTEKNTWNAKQNAIDNSHKLSSDLVDDTNHTNKFVTSTEKNTWNAKQNAIDADHKLSSSLVSFSTAEAAALASGIDSSKVGQISTNQTNILYALNKVGKNLFDFKTWVKSLTGADGGYFTYTDNSITLTATRSNSTTLPAVGGFHVSVKPSTQYVLVFIGSDTNGAITILKNDTYSGFKTFNTAVGDNVIEITTDIETTLWSIRFDVNTINQSSTISNVMIIPKEVYDAVGGDFQPYGAPNYDLTYREQQDRNALVEAVDKGAKNIVPTIDSISKTSGGVDITWTVDSDGYITANPTNSDGRGFVFASCQYVFSLEENKSYELVVEVKTASTYSSAEIDLIRNDGTRVVTKGMKDVTGTWHTTVTIGAGNGGVYGIVSKNFDGVWRIMLCTKSEYDINPTYVPYALPNYDLTVLESEDRAALAEVVNSGAKNLIPYIPSLDTETWNSTFTRTSSSVTTTATGDYGFIAFVIPNLKPGAYVLSTDIANRSGSNSTRIDVRANSTNGNILAAKSFSANGSINFEFTVNTTMNLYVVLYGCFGTFVDTTTFTANNLMLCTKAAWKISQNYAPFALPNTDLTRMMTPFFTVPINHNMIYRGQNLGETFTEAQDTALSSGNFTDLYLGDYWTKQITIPAFYEVTTAEPSDWSTNYTSYYTKSGDTYTPVSGDTAPTWVANTYYERLVPAQTVTLKAVIADFDTFYAGYASGYAAINTHHAAVIVTGFSNVVWNKTNSTAGGYVNSLIHRWLVGSALPQIETWLGSTKVLSHQKLLTNAITGDAASGCAWSSQKIALLSENQVYGSKVWGNSKAVNGGYEPGEAFKHLNVFNHIDANLLFGNKNIWLRDIASAVRAASLYYYGAAYFYDASHTGVAPAALILLS